MMIKIKSNNKLQIKILMIKIAFGFFKILIKKLINLIYSILNVIYILNCTFLIQTLKN